MNTYFLKWKIGILLISILTLGSCSSKVIATQIETPENKPLSCKVAAERTELYLPLLSGKKVGFCGNQTSIVGTTHLVDTLVALRVDLVCIFSPEHGFRGEAEAGAHISSSVDPKTGIAVVSLYGKNKKPTAAQMDGLDIILFDIQDVGCRFYTYISTLHYLMESAAENGVELIILDRPNPNGYFVNGPVLDMNYTSFVGMHPVPVVHGMTIGEYGRMINGENWLPRHMKCKLTVIPMEYYDHKTRYSLPISPSPNLQTDESIYLYPSLCLFEGTSISLGRGTPYPFQIYGHPSLKDGDYYFTPEPIKHVAENPPLKGKKCRGYNLTEYARENLHKENQFSLQYLLNAYHLFPDKENFFSHADFFDKLAGNSLLRKQITDNLSEEDIRLSWQPALNEFKKTRKKYLLYPDFE